MALRICPPVPAGPALTLYTMRRMVMPGYHVPVSEQVVVWLQPWQKMPPPASPPLFTAPLSCSRPCRSALPGASSPLPFSFAFAAYVCCLCHPFSRFSADVAVEATLRSASAKMHRRRESDSRSPAIVTLFIFYSHIFIVAPCLPVGQSSRRYVLCRCALASSAARAT